MQIYVWILFLLSSPVALLSQTRSEAPSPKFELFGGYSYLHRIGNRGQSGNVNPDFNGWETSLNYSLNRWLGVKADLAGHYNHVNGTGFSLNARQHDFQVGPQLSWRFKAGTLFGHSLVGVSHQSGDQVINIP